MKRYVSLIPLVVTAAVLAGCQPGGKPIADEDAAALRKEGYARAPQVTGVIQTGPATFEVTGRAVEDRRVNIAYLGQNAAGAQVVQNAGFDADSKGAFKWPVPSGPAGGIYDLSMTDQGRDLQAEGRLFVPLGAAGRAVILRPGGASTSLNGDKNTLAVIDYDGAGGLAAAGRVEAGQTVNLIVDGIIVGRSTSDDTGRYHVTAQLMPPPTAVPVSHDIAIEAGDDIVHRTVVVSLPVAGDRITRLESGWRVDWKLPGGGVQTTMVY